MSRFFDAYRAFHEQGFIPIFVRDEFDSKAQLDACLQAGCKGIEYTLRRPDAREMIPWIRKNYPELYLLVGSTFDDEKIVRQMRRRHPQLMTIDEVADMGVDGFVSMLPWRDDTIRKYAATHVIIPNAMTVGEAVRQTSAGASFIKILGPTFDLVRRLREGASFDYCPVMITGGMSAERIPQAVEAGAVLAGAGFDVLLKGISPGADSSQMAESVRRCLGAVRDARAEHFPRLAAAVGADRGVWLDWLPHYHPFDDLPEQGP